MGLGKCKLCNHFKVLAKQSHIIPNFMYQGLKDDQRRIALVNLNHKASRDKDRLIQTGIFDKHILCLDCETAILADLDKYGYRVLFDPSQLHGFRMLKARSNDGMRSIKLIGIDYQKFKRFILSLAWRSHHSKHKFFKSVNIADYEPILKDVILNKLFTEDTDFAIFIASVKASDEDLVRMISEPGSVINGENSFVTFLINGFIYHIHLNRFSNIPPFIDHRLRSSGEIEIPIVDGHLANKMLRALGIPEKITNYFTR